MSVPCCCSKLIEMVFKIQCRILSLKSSISLRLINWYVYIMPLFLVRCPVLDWDNPWMFLCNRISCTRTFTVVVVLVGLKPILLGEVHLKDPGSCDLICGSFDRIFQYIEADICLHRFWYCVVVVKWRGHSNIFRRNISCCRVYWSLFDCASFLCSCCSWIKFENPLKIAEVMLENSDVM